MSHSAVTCRSSDFVDAGIVSLSDSEAIFIVLFTTLEALDDLSKNVAAPRFTENMMPCFSAPVQRSVDEVAAHIEN
jgi:hypothetical protein